MRQQALIFYVRFLFSNCRVSSFRQPNAPRKTRYSMPIPNSVPQNNRGEGVLVWMIRRIIRAAAIPARMGRPKQSKRDGDTPVRFFSFRKERMVTASRLQNHPVQKALNPQ